jgi:CHAT domain-containing protein
MATFQGGLASGAGEARALAQSQRRALADARTADPFYWAGLILTGGY